MIAAVSNFGCGFRGILALSLALSVSFQEVTVFAADAATDSYKTAVGHFKLKRYEKAADQFRKFLNSNEKHEKAPLGRLYLGLSLLSLNKYDEARIELRRFAEENPKNDNIALARFRIGECSYLMDDLANARQELEAFNQAFPDHDMGKYALPYLGDIYLRLEKPDAKSALAIFDRAIEKFAKEDNLDDAIVGRARSLELLKRFDEALVVYQQVSANEEGPRAADALFHLGAIRYERKEYSEAVTAYTNFINKYPQSPMATKAQLYVGYAQFELKKYDEALHQFENVAKDPSQKLTAMYWQGRCLKSLRDYTKAAEVLSAASRDAGSDPLEEAILFEQGICERKLDHLIESRRFFESVLQKYSSGTYADDSLHHLIEMSIEAGDLPQAEQLLAKFRSDFPKSPLRLLIEMLNGRLDLVKAGKGLQDKKADADLYESAGRRFEQVLKESSITRVKREARYYLALTNQLQKNSAKALETIKPLVDEVLAEGSNSDFADAVVLQADCYNEKEDFENALGTASKYLKMFPAGRQIPRALAIQSVAAEKLNQANIAETALNRLSKEYASHSVTYSTLQRVAESAEDRKDWPRAEQIYDSLAKDQKDPEKRIYALQRLAQIQFSQSKFLESADAFGKIIKEFPNHELVIDCRYHKAEALKEAKQTNLALEEFQQLFESCPTSAPAQTGEETKIPLEFYYKAGCWAARILHDSKQYAKADAIYVALLQRFPRPVDLETRLKEWAEINFEAENFDRSDEIWRRLLAEVPQGTNANLAKLYLAESDFVANKLVEARATFEELLGSDKSSVKIKERALYQLVVLAVGQQRWSDVRELGSKLTFEFPTSRYRYYVMYSRAEAYLFDTDPNGASSKLTEKELEEERIVVRTNLESLRDAANTEEARELDWYSRFGRVWFLLAELNFREKKYSDVEAVVKDLELRDPKSDYLYLALEVLGRSFKQRAPAKFQEARQAFERVISNPIGGNTETAAAAQFNIGDTYAFEEKWDDALEAYNKVFSIYEFPAWKAEALFSMAKCDEQKKDWKAAIAAYKLLIESYPKFSKIDNAKELLKSAQTRVNAKSK